MNIDIITKDDLEKFKFDLLNEIKVLLKHSGTTNHIAKEWLKSNEVRKLLGISPGTLQNLRVNGTLPFTKIGSIIYYRYDDIRKLMQ